MGKRYQQKGNADFTYISGSLKLLQCHGLSQYIKQMVEINAEVVKKLLLRRLKYVFKKIHLHFEHSSDNKITVSNVK
jgi:hypothetical protein